MAASMLSGARNSVGLSRSLSGGRLPSNTHLTYEGLFNQLKYKAGPKTHKTLDLSFGYSRFQFLHSNFDTSINDYRAIFLKGKNDGEDRSEKVNLNLSICLDVSGSMGVGLGSSQNVKDSRLSLSVQAIKMLISKLKPNDSVSLVTFNDQADIIFNQKYKSELDSGVFSLFSEISSGGGTTIINGFKKSKQILDNWLFEHKTEGISQNRIVMITDVDDWSLASSKDVILESAEISNIHTSIIGVSSSFQSSICQKFKDIKGFNYFCAVEQQDIKKYVFQTFDFGFFASAYNITITIESDNLQKIEVFGSPDSDSVQFYNQNKLNQGCLTITKMKSCFPSEIEIHGDQTYIVGGLILVKLKKKYISPFFKSKINLSYDDPQKNKFTQNYQVFYQFHPQQQFLSGQEFRQVIEGFSFVSQLKKILRQAQNIKQTQQIYDKYWDSINKLQSLCPKAKLKDLQNLKQILKTFKKKQQTESSK